MEKLRELNNSFLDKFLITFNSEVTSISLRPTQAFTSVEDKFYSSITNRDTDATEGASSLIKQNNDYVFDKQFVNPLFIKQNTTETLLQTLKNEEYIQNQHELMETDVEGFEDVQRKMKNFLALQKCHREQEKETRIAEAVAEYRWLYQPKLISPHVKNFLHECFQTECIVNKFTETVFRNGQNILVEEYKESDCIFGVTLRDCLNDKNRQHIYNRLFLPGVYKFPKCLNTNFVFNKYVEQFYPTNEVINEGTDTVLSFVYNTIKFRNVNLSQTVSSFVKQCRRDFEQMNVEDDIHRFKKVQNLAILFLIMKKRCENLSCKRAERGTISSVTDEFIFKANKLYWLERTNLWCIYLPQVDKIRYTQNIFDMFYFIVNESVTAK
jgi:hypothetical protein